MVNKNEVLGCKAIWSKKNDTIFLKYDECMFRLKTEIYNHAYHYLNKLIWLPSSVASSKFKTKHKYVFVNLNICSYQKNMNKNESAYGLFINKKHKISYVIPLTQAF